MSESPRSSLVSNVFPGATHQPLGAPQGLERRLTPQEILRLSDAPPVCSWNGCHPGLDQVRILMGIGPGQVDFGEDILLV